MNQDVVLVQVEAGVGQLRLNRPAAANALNLAVADAITAAVARLSDDPHVATVLVTGAGRRFCAGGDMAALAGAPDGPAFGYELATRLDVAFQTLAELPKPVVVAVHGAVAGAGLALMLSCDVLVAERSTRFHAAYPAVGLTPDCGLSWLLPRAVGSVRALDLLLTDRVLSADEALEMGLVARVVQDGTGYEVATKLATDLAAGPAYALGRTKHLVRAAWETDRAAHGTHESHTIADVAATSYAKAVIDRFRR